MKPSELTKNWVLDRCEEDGDCLLWTRWVDTKGNPRVRFRDPSIGLDSTIYLRRHVYALYGNPKPQNGSVISMDCGNPRCLNHKHMVRLSRNELLQRTNARPDVKARKDTRMAKTTRANRGKLDMDKARYIRESDKTLEAVAEEMGVSIQTCSKVRRNLAWTEPQASPFAGLLG